MLSSCYRVPEDKLEVGFHNNFAYYKAGKDPSPFLSLNQEEAKSPWATEFHLGKSFAQEGDFYRAITHFKRAQFLLNMPASDRELEIHYHILLAYYFGGKFQKVISIIETGPLSSIKDTFPAYEDLKIILLDAYEKTDQLEKAQAINLQILDKKKRENTQAYLKLAYPDTPLFKQTHCPTALNDYQQNKLSPTTAQTLNALLPGAGYLYVGQKQSALTSFLLNSLFIAASINLFKKKQMAAALITSSLEMGWYLGGIHGAGLAAKTFNENLYYKQMHPYMKDQKIYPIFNLEYTF